MWRVQGERKEGKTELKVVDSEGKDWVAIGTPPLTVLPVLECLLK